MADLAALLDEHGLNVPAVLAIFREVGLFLLCSSCHHHHQHISLLILLPVHSLRLFLSLVKVFNYRYVTESKTVLDPCFGAHAFF